MGPPGSLIVIFMLIACSAFFFVAEIALASSRRQMPQCLDRIHDDLCALRQHQHEAV